MLWKGEVCSCSGRPFAPFRLQKHARCKGGHTSARGQRSYRHGRLSSLQSSLHSDKSTVRSVGHTSHSKVPAYLSDVPVSLQCVTGKWQCHLMQVPFASRSRTALWEKPKPTALPRSAGRSTPTITSSALQDSLAPYQLAGVAQLRLLP